MDVAREAVVRVSEICGAMADQPRIHTAMEDVRSWNLLHVTSRWCGEEVGDFAKGVEVLARSNW